MTDITQADRDAANEAQRNAIMRVGSMHEAFARHREQAAAEERAKIVAWLRERDGFNDYYSELKDQWLSDRIARGEYLK